MRREASAALLMQQGQAASIGEVWEAGAEGERWG
jgi:hypothetical protein